MHSEQEPIHWKANAEPVKLMQAPKDQISTVQLAQGSEEIWNVSLEPQRLRVFKIRFEQTSTPNNSQK